MRAISAALQVVHSSKVYTPLAEKLGLADHGAVLGVMLDKIGTNLRVHAASEPLVAATLALFQVRWPAAAAR